jgi:hypothetical protein
MQANERVDLDPQGHNPVCEHFRKGLPLADPDSTYVDLFCNCHDFDQPMILKNGTDVAWPSSWDEQQADEWRCKNNLAPPSAPGSGP